MSEPKICKQCGETLIPQFDLDDDGEHYTSSCLGAQLAGIAVLDHEKLTHERDALRAKLAEVTQERDVAKIALEKINVIRNSVVSFQTINWSEHIYPLVAALNEAGIKGKPYPADREYLGSVIDQRDAAIAERVTLRARAEAAEKIAEERRLHAIEESEARLSAEKALAEANEYKTKYLSYGRNELAHAKALIQLATITRLSRALVDKLLDGTTYPTTYEAIRGVVAPLAAALESQAGQAGEKTSVLDAQPPVTAGGDARKRAQQLLYSCFNAYIENDPEGDAHTFADWAREEALDTQPGDGAAGEKTAGPCVKCGHLDDDHLPFGGCFCNCAGYVATEAPTGGEEKP